MSLILYGEDSSSSVEEGLWELTDYCRRRKVLSDTVENYSSDKLATTEDEADSVTTVEDGEDSVTTVEDGGDSVTTVEDAEDSVTTVEDGEV